MNDIPVISIIVPAYNASEYLGVCIESIISQSFEDFELIIIDDGSTDRSVAIATEYKVIDNRIRVFQFENGGLSTARNRGIERAKGEYILFVDADDMLFPLALETLVKAAFESKSEIIEGITIRGTKLPVFKRKKFYFKTTSPQNAIEDALYQNLFSSSACGKLFKRSLFNKYKFEAGKLYEDLDIFYRLFDECHSITYLYCPVYFYRDTPGSIINSWTPKRLDALEVTEKIEKFIKDKYPSLIRAAKDRRLSANFNMFCLSRLNGQEEVSLDCWKIIKEYRASSLFNKKVRLKNKIGIILSYLGKDAITVIAKKFY